MTPDASDRSLTSGQVEDLRSWLGARKPENALETGYQASVYLYRGRAGEFIVKEALGFFLRKKFSEAAIRREERTYRRLKSVPGVPKCFGLLDEKYLVLEYIPGDSFRRLEERIEDRDRFFSALFVTLQRMHEAGVAHGDLKRKDNILVGPGQKPYVVDFGIAILADDRKGFLFDTIKQADYNAWIKHKYRGRLGELSAEDSEIYKPMFLENVARTIRIVWQKLTLRRWRKRHRVR